MRAEEAPAPALQEGDWLDVQDGDGIWNVAQVLRLPTAETMEVTYDCWGDEYNEELRRDSARVAPFHTHTWAVKCWAKLATWPWWPALLTVRAPGSAEGSQSLRLEERLLVDFLDSPEFTERCRCWVKKSKIVPFQLDDEMRKQLTKTKKTKNMKRKKSKGEASADNMVLSTSLLAKCDAREDFPEFVEGTLPVQFRHNFTRPTEQVRKEMGEQIWMRGFADNRFNHAATHAYTPVISAEVESGSGHDIDPPTLAEEKGTTKTTIRDDLSTQKDHSPMPDAEANDKASAPEEAKTPKTNVREPQRKKTTPPKPKNPRKRARRADEDETSDSTDTSRDAEKATLPHEQTQEQLQAAKPAVDECPKGAENVSNANTAAKEIHFEPRKYGKTPKVLKTPRRYAANLAPYTPPYARVLLKVKPRYEQHTTLSSHAKNASHATAPRPNVQKEKGIADKAPLSSDRPVLHEHVAVIRSVSSDAKTDDGCASPMKILARVTKATLRADKKLHSVKNALDGKLTELAEKSAMAEELRSKCSALPAPGPPVTSALASETRQVNRDGPRRENTTSVQPDASRVQTRARRSLQTTCGIQELEQALDDRISKHVSLRAAPTRVELDAIKADLLGSPEVQAAIIRIQHPSYGWTTCGESSPSLSSGYSCRAFEKAKFRYTKYISATEPSKRGPLPRSPSQHLGRSWGYERDSRASADRLLSRYSVPPPAESSSFSFSVNDSFSMNQWYRDLYPKTFGFQRP